MNKLTINTLKILRKLYQVIYGINNNKPNCELNPSLVSDIIYNEINAKKPLMIARFGAFELATVANYIGVMNSKKSIVKYIKGEEADWEWNAPLLEYMNTNAGFFPPSIEKIQQFCELMLEDKNLVDILGSWRVEEKHLNKNMCAKKVHLRLLEPFWSNEPWTKALKNKKILVVHPFSRTILAQYEKRELLFENKDVLPKFKSLTVVKAVQSLGKGDDRFKDWFEALEYMQTEIDKVDYDICLIGAGAYGFPLAAHVKRKGKIGIHMGGALQLLFGIRGTRWEDPNYGVREWGIEPNSYVNLMNEHWVRPNENEKPQSANKVEGACYW